MTEVEADRASVAEKHPHWHLWESRPYATRSAAIHRRPDLQDAVYAESVLADDYDELDERLTAQDENDKAHAA